MTRAVIMNGIVQAVCIGVRVKERSGAGENYMFFREDS